MALYLTEGDVGRLLSMEACVEAVETAFRQWADGRADNRPRARASVRGAVLHALAAGSEAWGRLAAKVYATSWEGARFMVLLFDARTAGLLAAIEADRLGQTRTGAASGVASRWLARKDARSLAIIGTGWQARGQAKAIATVRRLEIIRVFGRSPERLREFCRDAGAARRPRHHALQVTGHRARGPGGGIARLRPGGRSGSGQASPFQRRARRLTIRVRDGPERRERTRRCRACASVSRRFCAGASSRSAWRSTTTAPGTPATWEPLRGAVTSRC